MFVAAIRGGLGFLTSVPIGRTETDWEAFVARPGVIPVVGYVVGLGAALPFVLPLPAPLVGFLFVLAIYLATGINHVDGLLDVADGVSTHGDEERAREAMKDSSVGAGAVLTLGVLLIGLFAVGYTLAAGPIRGSGLVQIVGLVVASEVAAKLAMIVVLGRGSAAHDGLGRTLSRRSENGTLVMGTLLAAPAVSFTWPHPAAALAVAMGGITGVVIERWADGRLGGISGDVLGATNEIARLVALGSGVIAWTLW